MSKNSPAFALRCSDVVSTSPGLTGGQAHGRLDALMVELTLRQA